MFARFKSVPRTDTAQLFQWDVYVQRCDQFPGLALPLEVLLLEQAHVEHAVTDQAQSSIESFHQCDAAWIPNSSL